MYDVMTARTRARPAHAKPSAGGNRPGFRSDVEGLRAVAVGLVLLYHAGLSFVPGGFIGVDVFFVISGFLITGLLVREVERTGGLSLLGFYARRAKRLLPAAGVVLATTAVLVWLFVPRVEWRVFGGDIAASAGYVINWRLADRSVDYLAEDVGASPVQHFWSLAVEEQFYLVWPLLVIVVAWWVRQTGRPLRSAMAIALALVAVPSLLWSVHLTGSEPARAYFVTTTRMWELALGAAVAIAAPVWVRLGRVPAIVLGWCGLLAVVGAGVFYTTDLAWPGYAALLPTLGTAAVIAAGVNAGDSGPVVALGRPSFVWVGGLSYSLYLWHWPLVIAATHAFHGLTAMTGTAVVAVSFIPAWLTHRLVEDPARYSRALARFPRRALAVGGVITLAGVVAGLVLVVVARPPHVGESAVQGAAVLDATPEDYVAPDRTEVILPDPLVATEDVPDSYARGCQVQAADSAPVLCDYGDPEGDVSVAVVGDSKAVQWISALDVIGEEEGWQITTYTKSACAFSAALIALDGKPFTECTEWNTGVMRALTADPPDVVLTSHGAGSAYVDPDDPEAGATRAAMVAGLRQTWKALTEAGSEVVVLRDNPRPTIASVYECVSENMDNLAACAFERSPADENGGAGAQVVAAKELADVHLVDLNDFICPGEMCPAVIGSVLVYRQGSHLTKTYVDSLTPRLEAALVPITESLGTS
jgi:peptidoglycan/LPS O-acetylase OafA/YrhL